MADVNVHFKNPLTEDHLHQINGALDGIKFAYTQIDMAERAGIDVSSQKQAARDAEKRLLAIKQVYFPGR
jgi:hypothetical protein